MMGHLGVGDHLLCNGLIRQLSKKYKQLKIPCWPYNHISVSHQFSDLPNVETIAVLTDDQMSRMGQRDTEAIRLGYYSQDEFLANQFDREFYRQANIPFHERWDSFLAPRSHGELTINEPFTFIHEDTKRGFYINRSHINTDMLGFHPANQPNIFDCRKLLETAQEIHAINSCFLILADSIETQGKLFFHHYARPTVYPTLRKDWTILR